MEIRDWIHALPDPAVVERLEHGQLFDFNTLGWFIQNLLRNRLPSGMITGLSASSSKLFQAARILQT